MKGFLALSALLLSARLDAAPAPPVLLELFTSQGCSSCPPAEALLEKLSAPGAVPGYEIIPLAYHVDYWNYLGWADPYSSPAFSQRQDSYAKARGSSQVFTPQAIVNGSSSAVGSDQAAILASLRPLKRLSLAWDGQRLQISGLQPGAPLMVAISENGLETEIEGGENAGRKLAQPALVRSLAALEFKGAAASALLKLDPAWKRARLKAVAFQNAPGSTAVISAGSLRLGP